MTVDKLFLFAAAALITGGAAHAVGYVMGPEAIEFMGAPPKYVQSAKDGTWLAPVGTFGIAGLLVWLGVLTLRARKGLAGTLSRVILWVFATIFILRGILILLYIPPILEWTFGPNPAEFWFQFFASLVVLLIGLSLGPALSKTRARK